MADYSIRIEEHQEEYEYLLNIVSYKTLEGAKENVSWHVGQADGTVFSSVKLCPNGNACSDVVVNPSSEFSGDVNTYLLKFSFASGAVNGTYNIFLEQNESLKLLNIEIVRLIHGFTIPELNYSLQNLLNGQTQALTTEDSCAEQFLTFSSEGCRVLFGVGDNFCVVPTENNKYEELLQYSSPDSHCNFFPVWLQDLFNIAAEETISCMANPFGTAEYYSFSLKKTLPSLTYHFATSIDNNKLTITNVDFLKCKCDLLKNVTNLYQHYVTLRLAAAWDSLQNHKYYSFSLKNNYGDILTSNSVTPIDIMPFLQHLTENEVPQLEHEEIDLTEFETSVIFTFSSILNHTKTQRITI